MIQVKPLVSLLFDITNNGIRFIFYFLLYKGMESLFDQIVLACPNCLETVEEQDIVEQFAVDCKNCGKFSHIDSCKTLRDY